MTTRTALLPHPTTALCSALICAVGLCATPSQARTPKPAKAASTPSTAQILAPSAATTPDPLPPDRQVWRCGNSYSARPCAGAEPLDVSDARSAEQRAQADDVAVRDKRLASWMEARRRERETPAAEPKQAPAKAVKVAKAGCAAGPPIACAPKKPRPRHATSKAASSAAGH
ncbi:MAG: hypothetical protein ABJD97_07630 [Betaproteobacteria bacterium]